MNVIRKTFPVPNMLSRNMPITRPTSTFPTTAEPSNGIIFSLDKSLPILATGLLEFLLRFFSLDPWPFLSPFGTSFSSVFLMSSLILLDYE
mgnify:CR=1 FL=1